MFTVCPVASHLRALIGAVIQTEKGARHCHLGLLGRVEFERLVSDSNAGVNTVLEMAGFDPLVFSSRAPR